MSHLTADQLSAHLDGALTGAALERAERHLAECGRCRGALAALASQEADLRPVLEHDPGDAYFESFAARVEERIRAAGTAGARERPRSRSGWLRSPRHLAWTGALAVTIVGAGVVLLTARLEHSDLTRLGDQPRSLMREAPPAATTPAEGQTGDVGTQAKAPDETRRFDDIQEKEQSTKQDMKKTEAFAPPPADGRARSVEELQNAAPQTAAGDEAKLLKDRREPATKRLVGARRTDAGESVPVEPRAAAAVPAPAPDAARQGASALPKSPAAPMANAAPAERSLASTSAEADRDQALTYQQPTAQSGSLCGRVVDGSGDAVARAQVTLVASGATTSTDANGRFCLAAAPGEHELAVMAIGFRTTRLTARAGSGAPDVAVTLPAVSVLEGSKSGFGALRDDAAARNRTSLLYRSGDIFDALPDSLRAPVRQAQAMVAEGRTKRSATKLDQAAEAWGAARARLSPGPIEAAARYRLAEARFLAWQLGPTPVRHAAAVAAVKGALQASAAPAETRSLKAWQRDLGP